MLHRSAILKNKQKEIIITMQIARDTNTKQNKTNMKKLMIWMITNCLFSHI
jgi:hypothetical protein